MPRNQDHTAAARRDQAQAQREDAARKHLMNLGASELSARPWRPPPVPPTDVDLAHFALWRSHGMPDDGILSALTLASATRAEVDGLEVGLLFAARSAGHTWAQIAETMGYNSAQACQQHFDRLVGRRGL